MSDPPTSQPIDWPPTPPKADICPSTASPLSPTGAPEGDPDGSDVEVQASRKKEPALSGREIRLRAILNALKSPAPDALKSPAAEKRPAEDPAPTRTATKKQRTAVVPFNPDAPALASVFMNEEQKRILALVDEGESVFYTGSAGTGKSFLLGVIIGNLRKRLGKSQGAVAVTATTGLAACNIGGVTIHSFAGISLGEGSVKDLVDVVRKNPKARERWIAAQSLVIDEVSMLDGEIFDKLSQVGARIRNNQKPFGGIQLIVTGDFFQLPPVNKNSAKVKFAFEAKFWDTALPHTFNLTQVFRQRDPEFVAILNELRLGKLTRETINTFTNLSRNVHYDDTLEPTQLFPRRQEVDDANSRRLQNLPGQVRTFVAVDDGDPARRRTVLSKFLAVESLSLRVDAQVMLIKNMDDTLVNGSIGRVMRFVDPAIYGTDRDLDEVTASGGQLYPVVEFCVLNGGKRNVMVGQETFKSELPSGELEASRTQLPLVLAWAMSIHKAQGQSIPRLKVDLGACFEKGQAYVALSRATSLDTLQVLRFNPAKVTAHPKVLEWSKKLATAKED